MEKRIQCLDRTLDILELISEKGELGVSEIGEKLGLHVATVHNILRTLKYRNYLKTNSDSGKYSIGGAMGALMSRYNPISTLVSVMEPALAELANETMEAATATVLAGSKAKLICFKPGLHPITIQCPSWTWDDPVALATGKLLVAFADEDSQKAAIKYHLDNYKLDTVKKDMSSWLNELDSIRDSGLSYLDSDRPDGQFAVAAPVFLNGEVIAAIGSCCPPFRADEAQRKLMIDAVQRIAQQVSSQI